MEVDESIYDANRIFEISNAITINESLIKTQQYFKYHHNLQTAIHLKLNPELLFNNKINELQKSEYYCKR